MSIDLSGVKDIISPTALEFNRNSIVFGNQLANVMVIVDYPVTIEKSWLAKITELPGVICSIHINPTDSYQLVEHLQYTANHLSSKLIKIKSVVKKQQIEDRINHIKLLLHKLNSDNQQVLRMAVLLQVIADTEEKLLKRIRSVEVRLAAQGLRGRSLVYNQEDGLKAVAPWAILPNNISSNYSFSMPSETIAASFPFTLAGVNDGKGIILGRDINGGVALIDMWNQQADRVNSNWVVLGKPGVGKSSAVKKILLNSYAQGCKVIVVDPEREYKSLCNAIGGEWIDICGSREAQINPLQGKDIPLGDSSIDNYLANHFNTLRTFFNVYLKELTEKEYALLEKSIEEIYSQHGINYNTNPHEIAVDQWPTMGELYDLLLNKSKERIEYEELSILLRKAAIGSDANLYNGQTKLNINSDFIVIDTHGLQESSITNRRTLLFNILTWAWNEIIKNEDKKIILAIDEAYLLVDTDTPEALQFLRNASKRIRKHNGSLITISQNTNDFLDPQISRYGQALIDNPTYKLIMGQGEKDLKHLTSLMRLNEAEIDILSKATRGETLLLAGSRRVHLRIELNDFEIGLFKEIKSDL